MTKDTFYDITVQKPLKEPLKIALLSDSHNCDPAPALTSLKRARPDFIAFAGDGVNGVKGGFERTLELIREAAKISPLFYCAGNHDVYPPSDFMKEIVPLGAIVLSRQWQNFKGVAVGAIPYDTRREDCKLAGEKDFLESFSKLENIKILLCHVPAFYPAVKPYDIDFILSGHAHGGQWRFFGRGLYAPHEGLFPKYTAGVYDGRLIVSRGLGDSTAFPRINNPHEVVYITLHN